MKRVITCACILSIVLVVCISSSFHIKNHNDTVFALLDEAIYYAENDEYEQAKEAIDELNIYWVEYYNSTSYIITNERLHDLSYSVARLENLLKYDNNEFFAECEVIRYGLTLIYDNEVPSLRSIF